ncbi:MAG: hypothetical protein ACLQVN_27100 [Bryobacteraceae bacterium]
MFPRNVAIYALCLCATAGAIQAQTNAQCSVFSAPAQVRAEGVTERLGSLVLQCSAVPSSTLSGNLTVYLPVSVTDRVNDASTSLDSVLSVNYGTGFVPTSYQGVVSGSNIAFYGIGLTVPASGLLGLQVSGLRANVSQLGLTPRSVSAEVSFSVPLSAASAVLAYAQPSLYATLYESGIACAGSPLPATLDLADLFAAGTAFASTRLTESFAGAFQPRGAGDDSGTRFLIRYSGVPSAAQLFVPTWVAGSDAAVPTAGGDLGQAQAVGQYVPGSGTLLLSLVVGADSTGAGGYPTSLPAGSGPLALNGISAVSLSNGSGYVVYEVADAGSSAIESAQFPTFAGLPAATPPATASETVSYAAVSSLGTASQTAPIPRFLGTEPQSDCGLVEDCSASYFPQLSVKAQPIQLTAYAGGATTSLPGYVPIQNSGGGILNWSVSIQYATGSGWLTLDNTAGQNNGSVRVWANAANLAAGAYTANLVIEGGPLGTTDTVPVTLQVVPAPSTVVITSVVNAATFAATPLVPGSLGTIFGTGLAGGNVGVTFNGTAGTVLYDSATQINFQVPSSLGSGNSATMVVTVGGATSAPVTVVISPAWPAVFNNGVLNQDNSVNAAANPATAGSIIQIFATGIPTAGEWFTLANVTATIGADANLVPLYAGAAPGLPGVQQVNVAVPSGLSGSTAPLTLCAVVTYPPTALAQQFCSPAFSLAVK